MSAAKPFSVNYDTQRRPFKYTRLSCEIKTLILRFLYLLVSHIFAFIHPKSEFNFSFSSVDFSKVIHADLLGLTQSLTFVNKLRHNFHLNTWTWLFFHSKVSKSGIQKFEILKFNLYVSGSRGSYIQIHDKANRRLSISFTCEGKLYENRNVEC